jgi:hypothetical protein
VNDPAVAIGQARRRREQVGGKWGQGGHEQTSVYRD